MMAFWSVHSTAPGLLHVAQTVFLCRRPGYAGRLGCFHRSQKVKCHVAVVVCWMRACFVRNVVLRALFEGVAGCEASIRILLDPPGEESEADNFCVIGSIVESIVFVRTLCCCLSTPCVRASVHLIKVLYALRCVLYQRDVSAGIRRGHTGAINIYGVRSTL